MGGFFNFLFGLDPDEDANAVADKEEDADLPEAPDPTPNEIDDLQGLIDRMNENQTIGMEDGIRFGEDKDEPDEEEEM